MCSWVPKKGKLVLLLSTLHQTNEIAQSGKPEIIEFYNQTKAGVDALDQKVDHYSTYQKTKHWPQTVFTIFLTLQPTMHLFCSSHGHQRKILILNKRARCKFLSMLGEALIKHNIIARSQLTTAYCSLRRVRSHAHA